MRGILRRARTAAAFAAGARERRRRRRAIRRARPRRDGPAVYYGHDVLPAAGERASGGFVKAQVLGTLYPNEPRSFNLLYLVSSATPPDTRQLLRLARRRGAAVVWNQNGVAYPGWAGSRYRRINRPMSNALRGADHVLYQSEFCKLSADRFLGRREGPWEVLHNAVDTGRFAPGGSERRGLTLLLGGNQFQRYRVETALRTIAELAGERPDARLIVTGQLWWPPYLDDAPHEAGRLIAQLGLANRVELVGPYAQADAPALFRRADVLLHTKFNDPCPGLVLEAMACGLPVVYSASGGVPELVGDEAGIGIPAPLDFERDHPPDPAALAEAVLRVVEGLDDHREAARRRAVERFDLRPWLERHRELFERLAG